MSKMFLHFGILLLLSPGLFGEVDRSEAIDAETRIIGGQDATPDMASYQISIRESRNGTEGHSCAGSIINEEYVLTAAHCIKYKNKDLSYIVAGSHKLTKGGDHYNIKKFVYHEKYSEKTAKNDIGVVQIEGKFKFNDNVQPIELVNEMAPTGAKCILTGWGYTDQKRTVPDNLQTLEFVTISNDECRTKLKTSPYPRMGEVDDGQICAKRPNNKGACYGDSGGPLVIQDENKIHQIGVVSWGVPCGRDFPDVFASVYGYYDWIQSNIK